MPEAETESVPQEQVFFKILEISQKNNCIGVSF